MMFSSVACSRAVSCVSSLRKPQHIAQPQQACDSNDMHFGGGRKMEHYLTGVFI